MEEKLSFTQSIWSLHLPWKGPLLAFLLVTALLGCVIWTYQNEVPWKDWQPNRRNLKSIFMEEVRIHQLVRQPMNTWSNLFYLAAGLICLGAGLRDFSKAQKSSPSFLERHPSFSLIYGFSATFLFGASFFFHCSFTRIGERLDITGVLGVLLTPLIYSLFRISHQIPEEKIPSGFKSSRICLGIILVLDISYFPVAFNLSLFALMPAIIVLLLYLEIRLVRRSSLIRDGRFLWASLASLVLAVTSFILDILKKMGTPRGVCQGHALWHFFTAAALLALYLYYRSERSNFRIQGSYNPDRRRL